MLPPDGYEQILAERAAQAAKQRPGGVTSQLAACRSDGIETPAMRGSTTNQQPSTVSGEAHPAAVC